MEKEMFAEKLRLEIHEFQNKSMAYQMKNKELLEIENAYRVLQVKQNIVTEKLAKEMKQQSVIVNTLSEQVEGFEKQKKLLDGAKADIESKSNELGAVLERREDELGELKQLLSMKNNESKQMQGQIEDKKDQQQALMREFENQKENLFSEKERKDDMEEGVDQIAEKLREVKNSQFVLLQSAAANERDLQDKRKELKDEENKVISSDSELTRLNTDLQQLQ